MSGWFDRCWWSTAPDPSLPLSFSIHLPFLFIILLPLTSWPWANEVVWPVPPWQLPTTSAMSAELWYMVASLSAINQKRPTFRLRPLFMVWSYLSAHANTIFRQTEITGKSVLLACNKSIKKYQLEWFYPMESLRSSSARVVWFNHNREE